MTSCVPGVRRAAWGMAVSILSVTACETPTVPFTSDQYDFRLVLASAGSRTFHWPAGADVPVFVNGADVGGRPSLSEALDGAGGTWTRAAVFSEVRLRRTVNLDEAVAVLQWSDTEPILSTPPSCTGPSTGAAYTRGCVNEAGDSLRTWARRDGGASRVRFTVVIEVLPELDAALVRRLVTHEAGHVMGILNHSNDPDDLMWGGILRTGELSSADRQTLRTLYQSPVDLAY